MLAKISLVTISKKYFKYLSVLVEKKYTGQEHVSGLMVFFSLDSDKYLKYFLLIVTRLISPQHVAISNKYFKYLSESPEINSLGPDTCPGHRLKISCDSDKYLKYLLIVVTCLGK